MEKQRNQLVRSAGWLFVASGLLLACAGARIRMQFFSIVH
jgi:hypothetical protein